jgi:hypothetical protein
MLSHTFIKSFIEANELSNAQEVNQGCCGDFVHFYNEYLKEQGLPELKGLSTCNFVHGEIHDWVEYATKWNCDLLLYHGVSPREWIAFRSQLLENDKMGRVGYHVWMTDGQKHYDAECPEGVENPLGLPFFQRFARKGA